MNDHHIFVQKENNIKHVRITVKRAGQQGVMSLSLPINQSINQLVNQSINRSKQIFVAPYVASESDAHYVYMHSVSFDVCI